MSLGEVLTLLIDEHEMCRAHAAYARLRGDPVAWGEYEAELAGWDDAAGDGLGDAHSEYPEFNQ